MTWQGYAAYSQPCWWCGDRIEVGDDIARTNGPPDNSWYGHPDCVAAYTATGWTRCRRCHGVLNRSDRDAGDGLCLGCFHKAKEEGLMPTPGIRRRDWRPPTPEEWARLLGRQVAQ